MQGQAFGVVPPKEPDNFRICSNNCQSWGPKAEFFDELNIEHDVDCLHIQEFHSPTNPFKKFFSTIRQTHPPTYQY